MAAGKLFPRTWKVQVDNLDVSALDVEFKILSTLKPEPNKCVLTLWNVNPDHRAQLLKRNQPNPVSKKLVGVSVQVEAGYVDNTSVLFSGDLREVASRRDNNNWKTMLSGDDGGRSYREARFQSGGISFRAGTSIGSVIQQCADAMGIGTGNAADFEGTAQVAAFGSTLPGPMVLDGAVATGLTRVLASVGLTWSIQRGTLRVQKPGKPLDLSAILVSPDTGLLDSPEASIDSSVSLGNPQQFAVDSPLKAKKHKPRDPGILRLRTMLIPGMFPGRKIDLQSQAFNGGYYLTEVEAVGQSWSTRWELNCVARAY